MDWYDISDHSWLETAFGDVNSDGYFDATAEEPAVTDLYVGSADDDSFGAVTSGGSDTTSPAGISAFAEHSDPMWWMLSDDPDAQSESDQNGTSVAIADPSDGWHFINTGEISAPPW